MGQLDKKQLLVGIVIVCILLQMTWSLVITHQAFVDHEKGQEFVLSPGGRIAYGTSLFWAVAAITAATIIPSKRLYDMLSKTQGGRKLAWLPGVVILTLGIFLLWGVVETGRIVLENKEDSDRKLAFRVHAFTVILILALVLVLILALVARGRPRLPPS